MDTPRRKELQRRREELIVERAGKRIKRLYAFAPYRLRILPDLIVDAKTRHFERKHIEAVLRRNKHQQAVGQEEVFEHGETFGEGHHGARYPRKSGTGVALPRNQAFCQGHGFGPFHELKGSLLVLGPAEERNCFPVRIESPGQKSLPQLFRSNALAHSFQNSDCLLKMGARAGVRAALLL